MRSIGIWYSPINGLQPIDKVELHFNLWKAPSKNNSYVRFIDIGIMLERTDSIKELKIYLPVQIKKESIKDIVKGFVDDNNLVCAIFNENYQTKNLPNSKTHQISDSGNQHLFDIYNLDTTDYVVENKFGGSIIKIIPPQSKNKTYFRIRINHEYCQSLISVQRPSNAFIQSAFSKIELTDFRVNEVRDLNHSLLEEINRECSLKISKWHFFYMISSNEEIVNYHAPFISCRNLEGDRWKKYVGQDAVKWKKPMLAYHWKKADNSNSFSILIKSKYESNNWWTILIYLIGLTILSIGFNIISSLIFKHL
jgi:hypothetical protein